MDFIEKWGNLDTLCLICGVIFFLDLMAFLPFFYVGFAKTEKEKFVPDRNGYLITLGLGWMVSAVLIASCGGWIRLAGTAFIWAVFRHYFIQRRWNSVRRGFGAPGFMSHWTAFYLLIIQLGQAIDSSGFLAQRFLTMARVDFAVIMICAGAYKYLIGYAHSDGMEYGRVNPFWGYFWRKFKGRSPSGLYVQFTNFCAFGLEILAGILMLLPGFEVVGALIITFSFFFVACYIRLGRLAYLMASLPMIFCPKFLGESHLGFESFASVSPGTITLLSYLVTAYIVVLPFVKINQYVNLFMNKSLPQPLGSWLSAYANWVPITIWRVFTPDVTNFFVRIYRVSPDGGPDQAILDETRYALFDWHDAGMKMRFCHVTESIALTSVFTTLKYFPSNRQLFNEKLLTYTRSVQHDLEPKAQMFRYEYVAIFKEKDHFEFTPVVNFWVDLNSEQVWEKKIFEDFDYSKPSRYSPVREAIAPGSYIKAGATV